MNTVFPALYTHKTCLLSNLCYSLKFTAKPAPTVRVLVEMNRKQMAQVGDESLSEGMVNMAVNTLSRSTVLKC